jgi:hypothetical protein
LFSWFSIGGISGSDALLAIADGRPRSSFTSFKNPSTRLLDFGRTKEMALRDGLNSRLREAASAINEGKELTADHTDFADERD